MLIPFLAGALLVAPVSADTTIAFGIVTRDLTGDTTPEVITLTGVGQTIDDLTVSFTIQSSGHTLYTKTWRLTRRGMTAAGDLRMPNTALASVSMASGSSATPNSCLQNALCPSSARPPGCTFPSSPR